MATQILWSLSTHRKWITCYYHIRWSAIWPSYCRFTYSCTHTGLAGSNDIENAEIWAIAEAILDTANEWLKVRNEKDATRKVSRLAPSSLLFCRLHCHTVRICIVMHRIMYTFFFCCYRKLWKRITRKKCFRKHCPSWRNLPVKMAQQRVGYMERRLVCLFYIYRLAESVDSTVGRFNLHGIVLWECVRLFLAFCTSISKWM